MLDRFPYMEHYHIMSHDPVLHHKDKESIKCVMTPDNTSDYALEFCILAAESKWNESSLQAVFYQGLGTHMLTELACQDESLKALIDLSIRLDNFESALSVTHQITTEYAQEPMKLGRTRLRGEIKKKKLRSLF